MGERYLIDTNIIIYLLDGVLPLASLEFISRIIESESNISVVTQMEVLGYPFDSKQNENKSFDFIYRCNIFQIDFPIVQSVIGLRQQNRFKLPDAIIAATALVHSLTLITRNEKDFSKIEGLKTLNPFTL